MKIFFADKRYSELADDESRILLRLKHGLLASKVASEVFTPKSADVILIQEKFSYKDFRYVDKLIADPILANYLDKVFTINCDDCATGLLRGIYVCLPRTRFNPKIHAAVPFMEYPNEFVFDRGHRETIPSYLASWRGNTKSNAMRSRMMFELASNHEFCLEATDSWLNHQVTEKQAYVDLILNAKFSLCPAGWAPVSFRIYESMALGRCPVILADRFVPPVGPDWSEFALFYPEKKISGLYAFLHEREDLYQELGARSLRAWNKYFSLDRVQDYMVQTLIGLIDRTPCTSKDMEMKRWRSTAVYWNNQWTLPQRVFNKAKKLSRVIVSK